MHKHVFRRVTGVGFSPCKIADRDGGCSITAGRQASVHVFSAVFIVNICKATRICGSHAAMICWTVDCIVSEQLKRQLFV